MKNHSIIVTALAASAFAAVAGTAFAASTQTVLLARADNAVRELRHGRDGAAARCNERLPF
jgi:hypothetical protein